jgi:hypothetical protein
LHHPHDHARGHPAVEAVHSDQPSRIPPRLASTELELATPLPRSPWGHRRRLDDAGCCAQGSERRRRRSIAAIERARPRLRDLGSWPVGRPRTCAHPARGLADLGGKRPFRRSGKSES